LSHIKITNININKSAFQSLWPNKNLLIFYLCQWCRPAGWQWQPLEFTECKNY